MNSIKEIITIVSACLGLIATAIGFLIPLVKNIKTKNRLSAIKKLTLILHFVSKKKTNLFNNTTFHYYSLLKEKVFFVVICGRKCRCRQAEKTVAENY